MDGTLAPTALVSWAHRDEDWSDHQAEEWIEKVVQFATLLMSNGVDVSLDLWSETDPAVDWTRWGPLQVQNCQLVIILASNAWRQRWEGTNSPHLGAGAVSEADALKGLFNTDQTAFQSKVLLVLLPGMGTDNIPPDLHRLQRFHVPGLDAAGVERLLRRIHGRPLHARPPLKDRPELPPKSYKHDGSGTVSNPIAAKRVELDEIKSGEPDTSAHEVSKSGGLDTSADEDTPSKWAAFSKPPLGEAPPHKVSLSKTVALAGSVAGAAIIAAFVASIIMANGWSASSPTEPTPRPTLPAGAGTPPDKLAERYDGTNPSGCAVADTATLNTLQIKRVGTNDLLATVEIKHSLACNTSWVRVINTLEGATVNKVVERRAGGGLPAYKKEDRELSSNFAIAGNDTSYSSQAYAPGCITASVQITDASGSLAGELPAQDFCWTAPS